jgi:DNA invertase Pin-like site-specific DNA recombinase
VVWKLDRLGRSLSHLLSIIKDLHNRGVAFKSLTEQMDTTTSHGEFLFNIFGSLAQYERALIKERVIAGLEAAKRRGHIVGRPRAISEEKMEAILEDLKAGTSKAEVCRNFGIKRTTLYDALNRHDNIEVKSELLNDGV